MNSFLLLAQLMFRLILLLNVGLLSAFSHAHELRPAIVDLLIDGQGEVTIQAELNLEAVIADIDPGHGDTDSSDNSEKYNALRKFSPENLSQEFVKKMPGFLNKIKLSIDDRESDLDIVDVFIPIVGDIDLPRNSRITLSAKSIVSKNLQWQWSDRLGSLALRVSSDAQPDLYTAYLQNGDASAVIVMDGVVKQSAFSIFNNYLIVGFTHILPKGLDHILFVVGLFLLSTNIRALVFQISSFTIAHTLTLALAMLQIINLSPSIVEPLIALSIVYVCVENIFLSHLSRWRPVLVFAFGLLHGLGFAGVLSEIGLSSEQFITGLVAFNIGVELGQLSVILLCFLLLGFWFKNKPWYRSAITIPLSILIAAIGVYWFVERVFWV